MVRLQLCVHYTYKKKKKKLEREIFPEQKAHPLNVAALHRREEATKSFSSHMCSHSILSLGEFPRFHCISSFSQVVRGTSPGARSERELAPTCSCELIP